MIDDPIIEELHRIREEIAARHNYDVSAIFKYFREKEAKENRLIVSFAKKNGKEVVSEIEALEHVV